MQQITREKSPKNDKSSIKSMSPDTFKSDMNVNSKAKVEMGKAVVAQFEPPVSDLDIIDLDNNLKKLCQEVSKTNVANQAIVPEIPQKSEQESEVKFEKKDGNALVPTKENCEPSRNFIPFENLHNVCFPFQNQGYCLRGSRCKFDHFPPELCPCFEWSKGICSRGYGCRFAHLEPRPPIPNSLMHKMEKSNIKFRGAKAPGMVGVPTMMERPNGPRPVMRMEGNAPGFPAISRSHKPKISPKTLFEINPMMRKPRTHAPSFRAERGRQRFGAMLQRERRLEREAHYYKQQYFRSLSDKAVKAQALNPSAKPFQPNTPP